MLFSCKKLIDVDPPTNVIVGEDMYASDVNAASILTGIYIDMGNAGVFSGINSISLKTGLSSDELVSNTEPDNILSRLYTNAITIQGNQLFWSDIYSYIFRINSALEGIEKSQTISKNVKTQLRGEALFLRAFMYFYLVSLYGDVPLLLSTDIKYNSVASRTSTGLVFDQIVKDADEARELLSDGYLSGNAQTSTTERTRPNKYVATALLARIYLYLNEWAKAEESSTMIINDGTLFQLEPLQDVFLSSSKEAIFQIQPVGGIWRNTKDAEAFILAANNSGIIGPNTDDRPVYLSSLLINSFEAGDMRKTFWTDSVLNNGRVYHYVTKYKAFLPDVDRSEYLMVFRLSELYLIRAEAKAQQGKILGDNSASEDLNKVRIRANLPPILNATQQGIINAILQERRHELFTEWGHRWLDLKRTKELDNVMTLVAPKKGGTWSSYKGLFPIPVQDILRNPSFKGHQNPGYPEQL